MNRSIQRMSTLCASLVIMLLATSSCSSEKDLPQPDSSWQNQTFVLSTRSEALDKPVEGLSVFLFKDGVLAKRIDNVQIGSDNRFQMPIVDGAIAYFLSNYPANQQLANTEVGSSLTSFLANRMTLSSDNSASLFYSGMSEVLHLGTTPISVTLKRSVARLDLDTSRDANITVKSITVEGAPSSSAVWEPTATTSSPGSAPLTVQFDTPITTRQDILHLYESATPVKITVNALYSNMPVVVKMSLPQIKRNYKYSITLSGVGESVTGTLSIQPWQDGGAAEATSSTKTISLNSANSQIPAGVQIQDQNGLVFVSDKGGLIKLAVASDMKIDMLSADGLGSDVTIDAAGTENKDGNVISFFNVNVKPQGRGRLPYEVVMHMKRPTQQYSYDEFYIQIAASPIQIPTVTLGGVTWMAFNATGRNLEDQIYPVEGETVADVYRNRWDASIGKMFQWGRLYGYTPWQSSVHNAGNQEQNSPWTATTHVPCPEGYRIPTEAELRALLPDNVTIPGTYTYNGETIKAELHNAGPVTLGSVSGTARYISLTSASTGNVLYIPLSGQKGDKSTTNNPGFGQGFRLWTNARSSVSGWSSTVQYWPGNANTGTIAPNSQLQSEGYAYLRCVKITQ